MYIDTSTDSLLDAHITRIDYSKNIDVTEYSNCRNIIDLLQQAGFEKRIKIKHRDYVNSGELISFGASSYEICFYNKLKEIQHCADKMKKLKDSSLKHKHNNILEQYANKEILRFEIRLLNVQKIKHVLGKVGHHLDQEKIRISDLYSKDLSKKICRYFFDIITQSLPLTSNDEDKLTQMIKEADFILQNNKNHGTTKMLCNLGSMLLLHVKGERFLRNISKTKTLEIKKLNKEFSNEYNLILTKYSNDLSNFKLIRPDTDNQYDGLTEKEKEIKIIREQEKADKLMKEAVKPEVIDKFYAAFGIVKNADGSCSSSTISKDKYKNNTQQNDRQSIVDNVI